MTLSKRAGRLILPALLAAIMVLGLTPPTQCLDQDMIAVVPEGGNPGDTIIVTPCSDFKVEVWTSGYPFPSEVTGGIFDIGFIVDWDESQMEFNSAATHIPGGWELVASYVDPADQTYGVCYVFHAWEDKSKVHVWDPWIWIEFNFHCKNEGVSQITIPPDDHTHIWVWDGYGEWDLFPEEIDLIPVTCNQHRPPPQYPVGGVVMPVGRLTVLAPYLAVVGLAAAVSVVYAARRRRRA